MDVTNRDTYATSEIQPPTNISQKIRNFFQLFGDAKKRFEARESYKKVKI